MSQTDPADVVRQAVDLLLKQDLEGWAGLFHPDGVVEFPFAPPGMPTRLDGRAAVTEYVSLLPDRIRYDAVPELEIHRTDDPETIVVEMRATGEVLATGGPYDMRYVAFVTARDGLVVRYREYWNPLTLLETTGAWS